jgi:hypothetical protein
VWAQNGLTHSQVVGIVSFFVFEVNVLVAMIISAAGLIWPKLIAAILQTNLQTPIILRDLLFKFEK